LEPAYRLSCRVFGGVRCPDFSLTARPTDPTIQATERGDEMAEKVWKLYGGKDPRSLPNYSLAEAAAYLRIPKSTLRAWLLGQANFKAVLDIAQRGPPPALSFLNLVEAHVLNSIREYHRMPEIRRALSYVRRELGVDRPLVRKVFETDGVSLFVEHLGKLLNVSQDGQTAMRATLGAHLRRLDFDAQGFAERLYPFTRADAHGGLEVDDPKVVVFDPRIAFGRLVVAGTGIPTSELADRFDAGDLADDLAKEYGLDRRRVEEAIRCERLRRAA
jgi:uncharacterized protein (DUF433 family)